MPPRSSPAKATAPIAVVIAGPNGAGKSTAAPQLLKGTLKVVEFLNADLIAKGLSPFDPDGAALAASEVLIQRMDALTAARVSFGLETTLAARTLAPRMNSLVAAGYEFHLVFLYLPAADLAVARVADRVRLGGHDIPESTIRRRYELGLKNFFTLYRPIATSWLMYDNSHADCMELIASGRRIVTNRVAKKTLWRQILQEYER